MKNQNEDGTWDLSSELDQESHDQLRSLWNVSALRANAANMGMTPEEAARAEFWTYDEYAKRVAKAAENPHDATSGPDTDPNAGTGSTPIPASLTGQQATGTGLSAPTDPTPATLGEEGKVVPRSFADPELAGKAYSELTNEQLRKEIATRNELREGNELYADDEPMSTDGNKADLVARLEEDDEADAPAEDESNGGDQR